MQQATRRNFLKLLSLGVIGANFDYERLLWIPGKKTIFIPTKPPLITNAEIITIEMSRIMAQARVMFERDDLFYRTISKGGVTIHGREDT